jgi:hypothetical protein
MAACIRNKADSEAEAHGLGGEREEEQDPRQRSVNEIGGDQIQEN